MIFLDGMRGVTTVFLLITGAFRMMDPGLEEASFAAGARNWTTVRRITLPVLRPAPLPPSYMRVHFFDGILRSSAGRRPSRSRLRLQHDDLYSTRDAIPNYRLRARPLLEVIF